MTMLLVAAIAVMAAGGCAALAMIARPRAAAVIAAGSVAAGSLLGLVVSTGVLTGHAASPLRWAWQVPGAAFYIRIDSLSAFFLLPLFLLAPAAAVYGVGYLRGGEEEKRGATSWFFFNLLVASMALVLVAANAILFLVAWEVMSLSSYFLVTHDDRRPSVREAGWVYLLATQLGTGFLLAFFALAARQTGSLDFDSLGALAGAPAGTASLLFVLALVGFGTKAGFVPVHVWLPEAHPAAPSHVSALMSGIMIKTGIYGIARTLVLLGPPPAWWGYALIAIGVTSGILGVLFALAQHDLKRLLAYHSVENIGIIALGLGVGVVGLASGNATVAALGFAGGLFHVLNHALFKGLLFLGAGAVAHATGTLDIERLGGLQKQMRWTGITFLVGAAAISGLPPLNGFASEFLVYAGAFTATVSRQAGGSAVVCLLAIGSLALIGGLASACFAKAFGIVFLGEPRTEKAAAAHEAGPLMRLPMAVLAALCILVGLAAMPVTSSFLSAPVGVMCARAGDVPEALAAPVSAATRVSIGAAVFVVLLVVAVIVRRRLLAGRSVETTGTWDCGYAAPTPRMQYTASSFAHPLTSMFGVFLRTHTSGSDARGFFPSDASFESHTPDVFREKLFDRLFGAVGGVLTRMRWLQHGRLRLYVLYIALTLVALLAWKLGGAR